MKCLIMIILTVLVVGCGSDNVQIGESPNDIDTIEITASGLVASVTLLETVSNISHEIPNDGIYTLKLVAGQSTYQLDIIDSGQQACALSDELTLNCDVPACTADYNPVCAKQPLAGVVCVTTPCDTAKYLTFSNACHARVANAWIAIESECLGLEETVSEHIEPVFITDLAVIKVYTDNYTILSSSIEADTLSIELSVAGGCGSHEFDFLANNAFAESFPVQLSNLLLYKNNDLCDGIITVNKTFDLEPIKEIYQRAYPNNFGEHTVILNDLGSYSFEL